MPHTAILDLLERDTPALGALFLPWVVSVSYVALLSFILERRLRRERVVVGR